jgi:hypothetical protein
VSAKIYVEGGGGNAPDSKELDIRCREGFRRLLQACGFSGRMPRLVASGGRDATFDSFEVAHRHSGAGEYVAMLIDSENGMADIEAAWAHLGRRDGWLRPNGATDEQVLLMVTCMETWIVTDHASLQTHYRQGLQQTALPPLTNMETRDRHAIQDALERATRDCTNAYRKGVRSFEILGKLKPEVLRQHLASFRRCERVLQAKL